jgi:hypothetical protein
MASQLVFSADARADDLPLNRTTFGEVGLLEMPSARMAPDGQLSITFGEMERMQRFNFAFQILPWLEGSFRYSHIPHFNTFANYYDRSFGLKIRLFEETRQFPEISLGMRDILGTGVYSGEYLVASKNIWDVDVTLGVGWGRFAQSGAFKNPLAVIFPSFATRAGIIDTGGTVNFGQLFHGPDLGVFGGAVWHTPVQNLDVLVEYSSDRYSDEASFGSYSVRSPINLGLSYHAFDFLTVSAGWYYGNTYGAVLSLAADPTTSVSPQRIGPQIPPPVTRSDESQANALSLLLSGRTTVVTGQGAAWVNVAESENTNTLALVSALMSARGGVRAADVIGHTLAVDVRLSTSASDQCESYAAVASTLAATIQTIAISDLDDPTGHVQICNVEHKQLSNPVASESDESPSTLPTDETAASQRIRMDISEQSLGVEALSFGPSSIWLYFSNRQYWSDTEAAGRIARVLMADTPSDVEVFHIVSVRDGLPLRDYQVVRSALERTTSAYGTTREMGEGISVVAPPLSNPALYRAADETYPRLHWDIGPGLRQGFFDPQQPFQIQLLAVLNANVDILPGFLIESRIEANIYNNYDFAVPADSVLPHVRTDLLKYLDQGANGISDLDAVYRTRVRDDVYFEAKVGYLEDMFAGAGAQVLWRPEGQRIAIGADVYQVWQRDFDRLFGVQDYHVLTGHVSVYYESPWYGLNFAIHGGRYLAGDYGATIEVTRRFDSGVEIGAFATFTNVPFSEFGEGSFDKGIIIHIPFEWALPFYSRSSYDLNLRSLMRDGGARLVNDDSLYAETRPTSYGEVMRHIDEIVAP